MKYFAYKKDSFGLTYSIDNTIFEYSLKYPQLKDDLIVYCYELQKNHNIHDEFWTRLNLKPCSHWNWCSDVVHLCKGIYLSIGKWNYIKDKADPIFVPVVRLEVNLNKHSDKEVLSDLLQWFKNYYISCYLIKYDLAVDIPTTKENVEVFGSRKERGLYKGTRYYGQRNQHGYIKIYDKGKEQDLKEDITRFEITLSYLKEIKIEPIYIRSDKKVDVKATTTDKAILNMLSALHSLGEDPEKYISMLDFRQRKKLRELLGSSRYDRVEIDTDLVKELLEEIRKKIPFQDKPKVYFEDKDGFLKVDENYNLPFD